MEVPVSRLTEKLMVEVGHHSRPHTPAHYYGVKVAVTVLVAVAILAPHLTHVALAGNLLWIWVDP